MNTQNICAASEYDFQETAQKAPVFQAGDEWAFLIGEVWEAKLLTEYISSTILIYVDEKYVHEEHTVHHMLYHIIFCPKRRKKVLVGKVADRLEQITREVAQENDWQIVELAIQPDHVHLFLQTNPYTLPTDIARLIKGRSSHDLREEFPHLLRLPSLWTHSTFYSTAGYVS